MYGVNKLNIERLIDLLGTWDSIDHTDSDFKKFAVSYAYRCCNCGRWTLYDYMYPSNTCRICEAETEKIPWTDIQNHGISNMETRCNRDCDYLISQV